MKAITLSQPWASLVALGVKTIETRSWGTTYRGPLAIHAGKHCEAGVAGDYYVDDDTPRGCSKQYLLRGPIPWPYRLPLGAIVATCDLVDVVPMSSYGDPGSSSLVVDAPHEGHLAHQHGGLWLIGPNSLTRGVPMRVEDQRSYGDFRVGWFAWLLANVEPLPLPIPASGHPVLWETAVLS